MNNEEYLQSVLVTEPNYDEDIKDRVKKIKDEFILLGESAIEISDQIDTFKKSVFYGKNFEETYGYFENDDSEMTQRLIENIRQLHSVLGIFGEAGELIKALHRHIVSGEDLDLVNIHEELGDLSWYMGINLDDLNNRSKSKVSFGTMFKTNIDKLKARFAGKFTSDKAINRNLKNERKILEKV